MSYQQGNPFSRTPDEFVAPMIRLDEPMEPGNPPKQELDPVAGRRALNFLQTTLGLTLVFIGATVLWGWPLGLLLVGGSMFVSSLFRR